MKGKGRSAAMPQRESGRPAEVLKALQATPRSGEVFPRHGDAWLIIRCGIPGGTEHVLVTCPKRFPNETVLVAGGQASPKDATQATTPRS
jgi:hypothetical protein